MFIITTFFKNKTVTNGLSILHINIRSIQKNLSKLKEMLINYQLSPDVIAITEVVLTAKFHFNASLTGYTFVNKLSLLKCGAVGFFIRN